MPQEQLGPWPHTWLVAKVSSLLLLAAVAAFASSACAGDTPPATSLPPAPAARTTVPGGDSDSAAYDAGVRPRPTIDVGGRVVDDLEAPVVGRPITLVDGRNERSDVLTDEDGGFWVMGVVPPYDLVVAAAPTGAVRVPLVYLNLTRLAPRLEVPERQGLAAQPTTALIRVEVKLPPCPATMDACWVAVTTASATGGGTRAGSYVAGTGTVLYEVDHVGATSPGEPVDVHVLVGDADSSSYGYARSQAIVAPPGEATDAGTVTPLPVEVSAPVTIAADGASLPEGRQWTVVSQLELPGGALLRLRSDVGPVSTLRLPLLSGATWRVAASAEAPSSPEHPSLARSSEVWSGTLPLTTTRVSLVAPAAPATVRPTVEGPLSRRGLGLAWDGAPPALASVALLDVGRAALILRAYTSQPALALARLEALGLPRLEPGVHLLDVATTPGANVDELTEPDPQARRERFDVHVPGATAYQRFRFQVTP
jgi:hypothetical protein